MKIRFGKFYFMMVVVETVPVDKNFWLKIVHGILDIESTTMMLNRLVFQVGLPRSEMSGALVKVTQ